MENFQQLLETMPKKIGKVKQKGLREITERNKTRFYNSNKKTLKKNRDKVQKYVEQASQADSVWFKSFSNLFDKKYPVAEKVDSDTGTFVLELAPMPEGIDIAKMKEMVNDYLSHRLEFYKEAKRSLFIEDEFSEWFVEKTTAGKQIGKGHIAMNVQTGANDGIDVFCIIMNKSGSNEKSLIQNFKKTGVNLDSLFKEKKFEEATSMFMKNYEEKLREVAAERNHMRNLYYLGFVSTPKNVYLVNFKINVDNIKNVSVKSGGDVNIILNNFISSKYGKVNLYKSKKRVELRLAPAVLDTSFAVPIYELAKPISDGNGDEITA